MKKIVIAIGGLFAFVFGQTQLHFTWNGSTLENQDHP